MSMDEVIEQITSEYKYYVGKIERTTAIKLLKNYRLGRAKEKTMRDFIALYGYELDQPATYKKVKPLN